MLDTRRTQLSGFSRLSRPGPVERAGYLPPLFVVFGVVFRVVFRGLLTMMRRVQSMRMRHMGVMAGLLVITVLVCDSLGPVWHL